MPARLLELQRVAESARGELAIGELGRDGLPFCPERFFIVHNVPRGVDRGGHAHKQLEQLLIAAAGAVTVRVEDGRGGSRIYLLDRPSQALHVPPMLWTEQRFTPGARLLVLASAAYEEADYIRDRVQFERLAKAAA